MCTWHTHTHTHTVYTLTLNVANGFNATVREGQNATVELVFTGEVAPGLTPIPAALSVVPGTATGIT